MRTRIVKDTGETAGAHPKRPSPDRYIIPVAAKTLDVLEAFRSPDDELTLQQVIAKTDIAHATAFRILYTLVHRGYLTRNANRYRLASVRRRVKIGYASLSDDVAISLAIGSSLRKAASAVAMDLVVVDNRNDAKAAVENARKLVEERVSVAIEFQNNAEIAPVIADIFATAAIPVIALHIPQPGAVYFGPDNYRAGWTAGTALAEHAVSRWRRLFDLVLLLDIPQAGMAIGARTTGVLGALEHVMGTIPADKIVRLDTYGSPEESRRMVVSCLREHKAARRLLISAVSDDNALAALHAVRELGLSKNCAIVGHDGTDEALRAIAEHASPFIGTVAFFPEQYGRQLIDLATGILRGDRVPPSVHVPHRLITRNNLNQFLSPAAHQA